ncbi:hypothetical protein CHLRE_13g583824v5 [Chlamydomonas reinhardtii]|mgnify:CR=1 FL=1|uniref:Uncharacterized protein n=1 Tax=Chlamydomonas reinhardtii TaxID=3055 RepID=A0A2K3D0J6_CHLRE|nr:uncharacterized protein CHLRE_13g583824v5 [Chlamydomonas reinhardtii]PNW74062.1 hypothetical protein CHLRE_13g583824v5 [Chlamydomonas reinhardtii]
MIWEATKADKLGRLFEEELGDEEESGGMSSDEEDDTPNGPLAGQAALVCTLESSDSDKE